MSLTVVLYRPSTTPRAQPKQASRPTPRPSRTGGRGCARRVERHASGAVSPPHADQPGRSAGPLALRRRAGARTSRFSHAGRRRVPGAVLAEGLKTREVKPAADPEIPRRPRRTTAANTGDGRRMPGMTIAHYPPADERGAERLRTATTAWSGLIGELHAVGLRPYLELEHGEHDDPLRLYCDLDNDLLLDVTIGDEGIPRHPSAQHRRRLDRVYPGARRTPRRGLHRAIGHIPDPRAQARRPHRGSRPRRAPAPRSLVAEVHRPGAFTQQPQTACTPSDGCRSASERQRDQDRPRTLVLLNLASLGLERPGRLL